MASHPPRAAPAPEPRDAGFPGDTVFALWLGAAVFVAFADVLLGFATFRHRDFGFYSYPVAHYLRESLWRGEMPLWNPLSNCGIPFLAQWSHLALYPPAWMYVALPLSWALGVFCVLHLYLAGFGMYRLAHAWTGHRLGAALAGFVFAFNGLTLNCLMWPHYMAVIGWAPWVLYTTQRACEQGGRRIPLAAAAGTMQMLGGTPEFILFTWLVALARCALGGTAGDAAPGRRWARFLGVVLLVAALAAPQLVPFLDLLAQSQRDSQFATEAWAMPPTGWANLLVPQFRCYFNKDGTVSQYGQYFTSSYYAGIAPLLLTAFAFAFRPTRHTLAAAGAVSLALVLALGEHSFAYPRLRDLLPAVGVMRYPAKFVFVAILCLPLLAAAGCRHALAARGQAPPGRDRMLRVIALLLASGMGGIVLYAWAFPFGDDNWPMTWQSALSRALVLVCSFLLLRKLGNTPQARSFRVLACALCLLQMLDVLTHYPRQTPTTARGAYSPDRVPATLDPPPRIGTARAMIAREADAFFKYLMSGDPARDYALSRQAQFSNCNLLDGIPKVDGFYALYPRHHDRLARFLAERPGEIPAGLLDFLGVSHTTSPTNYFTWSNRPGALPWITTGQQPRFLDDEAAFAALTDPGFNPRREVLLPKAARASAPAATGGDSELLDVAWEPHRVRVRVTNAVPAVIVLAQSHSRWWRARLDGAPTPLWRANYAFQAVWSPAGEHRLELVYEDWPFRIGWILALLGVVGATVLAGRSSNPRNSPRDPARPTPRAITPEEP